MKTTSMKLEDGKWIETFKSNKDEKIIKFIKKIFKKEGEK
jgi:hypothetical protein